MSDDRAFESTMRDWLDAGSDETPRSAIDAVLLAVKTTRQERGFRLPVRTPVLPAPVRLAAVIAILALVGAAGLTFINRDMGPATTPSPIPSATAGTTPSPSASPTAASTPRPTAAPAATIDTSTWTTFTSARYGYEIAHPGDWTVTPSERDWSLEADPDDETSPGADGFLSPDGDIHVTGFAALVPTGMSEDEWIAAFQGPDPGNDACPPRSINPAAEVDGYTARIWSRQAFQPCGESYAVVFVGDRAFVFTVWREGKTSLLRDFLSTLHLPQP